MDISEISQVNKAAAILNTAVISETPLTLLAFKPRGFMLVNAVWGDITPSCWIHDLGMNTAAKIRQTTTLTVAKISVYNNKWVICVHILVKNYI